MRAFVIFPHPPESVIHDAPLVDSRKIIRGNTLRLNIFLLFDGLKFRHNLISNRGSN